MALTGLCVPFSLGGGTVTSSSLLLSSLALIDTQVYEPEIRARLGTAAHFCTAVVLKCESRVMMRHAQGGPFDRPISHHPQRAHPKQREGNARLQLLEERLDARRFRGVLALQREGDALGIQPRVG